VKASVYRRYGSPDVVEYEEVEKPAAAAGEVLIKVRAAALNPLDWHFLRGKPRFVRLMSGMRRPKIPRLGHDLAGQVEAVGANVTRFRPGDEVFGVSGNGTLAEYVRALEEKIVPKPARLTFAQAAAIPVAALTALQGLRDRGRIQPGHAVLINGAAGGVGTFAVQIAKAFGAEVTAVCSTRNVDMVRAIGADHVIDYTREDFIQGGRRYDLLFDGVGNRSFWACRRIMTPRGLHLFVGGSGANALAAFVLSPFARTAIFMASINLPDLLLLKELVEANKLTPVIDRCYPLSQAADAIRYLEQGHARGKVVVTPSP
jgi:NADPH:quinone reductase-like Zn-dependent oxidoreductase